MSVSELGVTTDGQRAQLRKNCTTVTLSQQLHLRLCYTTATGTIGEHVSKMSIFGNLRSDQIVTHPFPYLVAENTIDESLCDELIRTFPPLDKFTDGKPYESNQKFQYRAFKSRNDPTLSAGWRQLIEEHLEPCVLKELIDLFRNSILEEYPDIERRFQLIDSPRCGVRFQDDPSKCDVLNDAQMIVHTPVERAPSAERGPHLKIANKLLEAYLYLRPDHDGSQGGDLEIFSVRPGCAPVIGKRQVVDRGCLEHVRTIPYKRNTLFVMLNTPRSIQAVSVRSVTDVPYMCFSIPVQLPEPLFALPGPG